LFKFAIFYKTLLLFKREKSAGFPKAPILRLYCRRPKTFAASSRRGSAFALDSSVRPFPVVGTAASRRVFPFRRGVVLARRGLFRLRSFEVLRKKRSGARLTLVEKGKNDVEEVCVFLGRRFLGFGFGRERLGARRVAG
jgi:hypothetical protein